MALITININESVELSRERIEIMVEGIVGKANERVSSSEQIKKYVILDEDLSATRDEITPTMKLKRNVVAANYKYILEKMYEN